MTTPTPAELAQQALDAYHATTVTRAEFEQRVKAGVYNPKDGSTQQWGKGDAALAAIIGATPPPPPPSGSGGLLGLYQLGGSLAGCSHLADDTYQVIVGDYDDAPLLGKTSAAETYAYTVTSSGVDTPSEFVILDSTGKYPNSLTPAQYVAKVAPYCNQTGCKGTFLDNCDSDVASIIADVTSTVQLMHEQGLKFAVNAGAYIAGNPGSDTGALWISWAQQLDGLGVDRIMCENWQYAATYQNGVVRTSGAAWYQNWDLWQKCVAAAPDKFFGVTYGGTAQTNAVYGRASMLAAAGVSASSAFTWNSQNNQGDPYNQSWCKANPDPNVNSQAGTATL